MVPPLMLMVPTVISVCLAKFAPIPADPSPPLAVREPLPLMVSVQPAGTLIAAFILPPLIVFVPSRVRFSVALFSSLIPA